MGLSISDVFTTLQATFGSYFINNFNLSGRTWQVNLQAIAEDRRDISDLNDIFIRNKSGTVVPLQSIASVRTIVGPQVNIRGCSSSGMAPSPVNVSTPVFFGMIAATCVGIFFIPIGLMAFFLESTFLSVLLFDRRLVPTWVHFFAALMVAFGTLLSSFWILSTNSWISWAIIGESTSAVASVMPGDL